MLSKLVDTLREQEQYLELALAIAISYIIFVHFRSRLKCGVFLRYV